ncbi:velvet factor-domain-containing protein [Mycena galericulata]|nr:velvet factor-domain-containing protein [Mycena galericulata]
MSAPWSYRTVDSLRHQLIIRQMPEEARASGRKPQDRRALDPVPTVELRLFDKGTDQRVRVSHYLLTRYTLFAFLVAPDSEKPIQILADGVTDVISGSSISSLFLADDPETDQPTAYFAFPDLGVRLTGEFRLKFVFTTEGRPGDCPIMFCLSESFRVGTATSYGGVQNSTPLTRMLAARGVNARIRNNARGSKPKDAHAPRRRGADLFASASPPSGSGSRPSRTPCTPPRQRAMSPPIIHAPQPQYPHAYTLRPFLGSPSSSAQRQFEPQPGLAELWTGMDFGLGSSVELSAVDHHLLADWFSSEIVLPSEFEVALGLVR